MVDKKLLLDGCKALMKTLEADLISRSHGATALPTIVDALQAEYEEARKHKRTAQNFEDWRSDYATQQAAAWVLSAVFVRFLEDNGLVSPPRLAGPGEALTRARDQHELYFREHPTETDREYLLHVFRTVAALPGGREIFGPHNPVFELPQWLSGDAAGAILQALQRIDANSGALVHDFTDPAWDTRFLGDLYQDLSEAARKKYALLQTPEFVEEFILDRTLDPALDEFGLEAPPVKNGDGDPITAPGFRMIDPACGSGHFLLGAFRRILDRWQRRDPGANPRELVQRALNSVHGVDINPFAIAIARFRLLTQALEACGVAQLKDAPAFHFNLAAGDSLLHGAPGAEQQLFAFDPLAHHYQSEDIDALRKILRPGTFHAVVANPPYIAVQDSILRDFYREQYNYCHGRYVLTIPFMERLFQLAVRSGYIGQITSNSFMKREFGKKLIEEFFPTVDLTHVIDLSGAYIPGHGTPTTILFGRMQAPITSTLRTVFGIRAEPSTPEDPAKGRVWSDITEQVDQPGKTGAFVSVSNSERRLFHSHPWSIGGGGAAELKEDIEQRCSKSLKGAVDSIGVVVVTLEDDVFAYDTSSLRRSSIPAQYQVEFVEGDRVRDWLVNGPTSAILPYDCEGELAILSQEVGKTLWRFRACLEKRLMFKRTQLERGLTWFEYGMMIWSKFRAPLSIVYAEVATHNHFVLEHGTKVFKQTAPVIKLRAGATEDAHFALLGLLNSSTMCFWMKQVCHQKQMMGGDGIRIESKTKVPYAFNSTAIGNMPLPELWHSGKLRDRLIYLTRELDNLARAYAELSGENAIKSKSESAVQMCSTWEQSQVHRRSIRSSQILLQEEIDFVVYCMLNLADMTLLNTRSLWDVEGITEGSRPFCILQGSNEDGFSVPPEIPAGLPADVQDLWTKRMAAIQASAELRLIETSMYKRRWIGRQGLFNHQRSDNELRDAAKFWLLDRLESYFDFDGRMNDAGTRTAQISAGTLCSAGRMGDFARMDTAFLAVAEIYTGDPAFHVGKLVSKLLEAESVPHLPVLRYKPAGLRKREEWEKTWALQRAEDAIDARTKLPKDDPQHLSDPDAKRLKKEQIGDIPVPPKYGSGDFLKSGYWKLRGKLDVPKERWVSFPHGEGQDGTLMVAWAGYDHLQLARALSAHYVDIQERLGGRDDPRLVPLLASLAELLPWLKQWHNDLDPEFNMAMGDYFEGFVMEEARGLGMTVEEVRNWEPVKKGKK